MLALSSTEERMHGQLMRQREGLEGCSPELIESIIIINTNTCSSHTFVMGIIIKGLTQALRTHKVTTSMFSIMQDLDRNQSNVQYRE